jgi:hypothetical protein
MRFAYCALQALPPPSASLMFLRKDADARAIRAMRGMTIELNFIAL